MLKIKYASFKVLSDHNNVVVGSIFFSEDNYKVKDESSKTLTIVDKLYLVLIK